MIALESAAEEVDAVINATRRSRKHDATSITGIGKRLLGLHYNS